MAEKKEIEVKKQLSIKEMGCDGKDAIRESKTVYLCRIFGEAAAIKVKEARSGDMYSYLIGEFRGVRALDGQEFESSKLFLPGSIFEQVEAALKQAGDAPVQFAYDIYTSVDEKATIGFSYIAKKLLNVQASDRLTEIQKQLTGKEMPKREAPAKKA